MFHHIFVLGKFFTIMIRAYFRSLDPRISDSDSHYFSLVQPPRSLLLQSRDPQHQPRSLVQQHIVDGGQDQPRVQGPPGDQGPPGGQNWPRLTDEKNPEDPVYSTIGQDYIQRLIKGGGVYGAKSPLD